jgi:hypothetical protein
MANFVPVAIKNYCFKFFLSFKDFRIINLLQLYSIPNVQKEVKSILIKSEILEVFMP